MRIFITGANGFIATHLAHSLRIQGHTVHGGSSRSAIVHPAYDTLFPLSLGSPLPETHEPYDWIIHCAYDKRQSAQTNTSSTLMWADQFLKRGMTQQIFISTVGVLTENSSDYVAAKKQTEEWFIQNNMVIVRPGLVIGDGGIFQEIIRKINSFPIIPLIAGGKQKVKLIGLNDLLQEIQAILEGTQQQKQLNLFYPDEVTFDQLLRTSAHYLHRTIFFISLPFWLIYAIAWIFETLRINIGISTSNVIGLKSNENYAESMLLTNKTIMSVLSENITIKKD